VPDRELTLPRLIPHDITHLVSLSDEEADNTYPPHLQPFNQDDCNTAEVQQAGEQKPMATANSSVRQNEIIQRSKRLIADLQCRVRRQNWMIRQMQERVTKAKAMQLGDSSIASRLMQNKLKRKHFRQFYSTAPQKSISLPTGSK
jgi:hypothetical protein